MCWVRNTKFVATCELRTKFYSEYMMQSVIWETSDTDGGHSRFNIIKIVELRAWIRQTMDSFQCLVMFNSLMKHWLPYNVAKFLAN